MHTPRLEMVLVGNQHFCPVLAMLCPGAVLLGVQGAAQFPVAPLLYLDLCKAKNKDP